MAIGGLAWWEAIKNLCKSLWESWLEYRRRQKLRNLEREKGIKEKEVGQAESDPQKMLQSVIDIKKAKDLK